MIRAIVYTSHAGHTKEYAGLLADRTGLPALEAKDAQRCLPEGTEILFLGWLMAGTLQGYKNASAYFRPAAVCAVGMSSVEAQRGDICQKNGIPDTLPLFCLEGGFEMDKVSGFYKFMMKCMRSAVGKQLEKKPDRTPEEERSLDMLMNGRNCVCAENLGEVLHWYDSTK